MDSIAQRTKERFGKAVLTLEKALLLEELPEHAERDAALLRFELAAELMPKVLQRILYERGADVVLPKDTIRAALAAKLVDEEVATTLLGVIDDRNRMVHDYSEEFASDLYDRIGDAYAPTFKKLLERLEFSDQQAASN